jgi:hypothetical protein
MSSFFSSLLVVVLSLAGGAQSPPAADADVTLDVPYVHQTEAMCGGATAAMLFRFWGDAHAGIREFDALVDRRKGGIATDSLISAVEARHWRVQHITGSIDALGAALRARTPVIVLLEDHPDRYHYVVVIGIRGDRIVVNDPAWGPNRPIAAREFTRRWQAARFWSLVILPPAGGLAASAEAPAPAVIEPPAGDGCDRLLSEAIDRVRRQGVDRADEIFAPVRARCPASAGPLRELAGVRFAERRYREAASLAGQAVARDRRDEYAWEVLASSRFVLNDVAGALAAWNQIGKPRVDAVQIEGLTRTRYALVADAMAVPAGSLLTAETFRRAERRLQELPDQSGARLSYRPQADGFANLDAAIVERASHPRGATAWALDAAGALVNRELTIDVPGTTGQGELWTASWRWWANRPRASLAFATPHTGWLPGVWRVEGSWDAQTYNVDSTGGAAIHAIREDRAHGGLSVSDWLTADLRYRASAGIDSFNGIRRAAAIGGEVERRLFGDRVSLTADATTWAPVTADPGFRTAGARAALRTSSAPEASIGWIVMADAGVRAASAAAPLAIWDGAGDGHARAPLLRAHPLLDDGIISGPVFGRRLAFGNAEVDRWIGTASPIRVAVAGFVDVAAAGQRAAGAAGDPFQIDAGVGLRLRAPGQRGTLRVDVGHGVRDGHNALTLGWALP